MHKRNIKFTSGDRFGIYYLRQYIDKGGNGEVWRADDGEHEPVAIKFLTNIKRARYDRFVDEVSIVDRNSDIEGILPIISHHLPGNPALDFPYYVMPLATPIPSYLKNKSPFEIIEHMIPIAETLLELHRRNISHRDIKPANLLFYKNRVHLSDFGLVDYPDKKDITLNGEPVGPKWTIAPEMRREAYSADGKKADPYSFLKTLWILLTKQKKGFDGQYSPNSSLAISRFVSLEYYKTLDDLLVECTDNDPIKRNSFDVISKRLKEWLVTEKDYEARNKLQWKDIQEKLFPSSNPTRVIWEDIESIVNILKMLSTTDQLNHVFIPTGGGNDLVDVRLSHENGCIELDFEYVVICKPKRLVFESFNYDEEWNYFRLECDGLDPSGYYPETGNREVLTELAPLLYTDANCEEYNDFDGKELPTAARSIERFLIECSFVIFRKTSTYNQISSTYDARHNKMTTDKFRRYIDKMVKTLLTDSVPNKKKSTPINLVKPNLYRTTQRQLTPEETATINKVIELASERDLEHDELRKNRDIKNGTDFSDDGRFDSLFDPRPKEDALKEFLVSLSKDKLTLVGAVMYGGRDGHPPWGTPLNKLIDHLKNDPGLIISILEKSPLVEYLKAGMQLYGQSSI
jgi:serine/threonine protein kinase